MRPAIRRLQNWPLAVALLGGVGLVITFLAPIFTVSVRWGLIVVVLAFTLRQRRALAWIRTSVGMLLVISMCWGLMTYFWSLQPLLTIMKAVAFALVVVSLTSAGYRWLRMNELRFALAFLAPLMVAAVLAGVLGQTYETSYAATGGMDLYRGLTSNPNMFGSLMFMISPLLLWQFHCSRGRTRAHLMWGATLALVFGMLLLSVSRSSILAFFLLMGAYGLSLPLARRTSIVFFAGLAIATAVLMWPGALDKLEARYVRKNIQVHNAEVAFSRLTPWEISWDMAKQGGWFGAGYGVSIDAGSFQGGLTAVGYGREKGNTQLAIMEESGIVGLALHLLLVITLVGSVLRVFRSTCDPNVRALAAIVLGALVGALVIGVFEAWWVAPGAPESLWFWTMAGVALALGDATARTSAQRVRRKRRLTSTAAPGRPQMPSQTSR